MTWDGGSGAEAWARVSDKSTRGNWTKLDNGEQQLTNQIAPQGELGGRGTSLPPGRLAVKSSYMAGLDLGAVSMRADPAGSAHICPADPWPGFAQPCPARRRVLGAHLELQLLLSCPS